MTLADCELIANAIAENKYIELDANACQLIYAIAEALKKSNRHFDYDRFIKACGVSL